jgi:hypothetical protein
VPKTARPRAERSAEFSLFRDQAARASRARVKRLTVVVNDCGGELQWVRALPTSRAGTA